MTGRFRSAPLVAVLTCLPSAAYPQLGEVHLGSVVSYGTAAPYGVGAGLILGVAAGRLAYLGLRWAYQTGNTESAGGAATPIEVTNRMQVFAADLGLLFPAGALEIVPGASVGVARFAQRSAGPTGGPLTGSEHATEFFAAPGLSVQAHVIGLVFIPEMQYYLVGNPDLSWPVSYRGPVASLRVVVSFEVDRIRY